MHTASLLPLLTFFPLLLPAQNNHGTISGRVTNPEGIVGVSATNLNTGRQFSAAADVAGEFTLTSLPSGLYRIIIRNQNGTAVTRRYLKLRAGATVRLNARLESGRAPNIAGTRAGLRAAAPVTAADLPPVIFQFEESSRYLNAVVLIDDNTGWAVGDPHWDQATRQTKGAILKTTNGGITWNSQDPGVLDALNDVFFLNASQGWAAGDNGTTLSTSDGGTHWTVQPVSTGDSFRSVFFTDTLNGWATSDRPTQYWDFTKDFVGWQAGIWHTTNGGQSWSPQAVPASASLLKRIVFVNPNTGFAAGMKQTGYDAFGNPTGLGAIYGTTDGGRTWNEVFTTSAGLTFTALNFVDASNGWASGFPHASDYKGTCTFHTTDGGKTWQPQNLGDFDSQVRDLHMLDRNRGYAAGTAYIGDGTAVWRTLDGGTTWSRVRMQNTNPITDEGYWGLAVTANRALIVGDRDATAFSSNPWGACGTNVFECSNLFTQAYISPHYIFHDVFFTDRNHGWATGTRSFSPQLWGQVILGTQDGGQTWTTQFERGLTDGLFSYYRLESIWFADASNGWAAGSSELFTNSSGTRAFLGCILHTADGGKTWTDQASNICKSDASDEFSAIQFLDAQKGWALATELSPYPADTIQVAQTTDGGNHWTMVDTGIAGEIAVGYALVQGGLHFVDAQHGCFGGWNVAGCTSDGGAHWTKSVVDCGDPLCYLNSNAVGFTDALHGWIAGGPPDGGLYRTTDGGAHWSLNTPKPLSTGTFEGLQFLNSSIGWLSGDGGLLFRTPDAGETWTQFGTGTGFDLLGLSFPDAQHGWIAGDFGTILSYAGDRSPAGKPAVFFAVNAASYASQTAPNAWISIFGANLSATTRSWTANDFTNNKLPTRLDGVSVLVNGNPAYLSYISPGQINAMFPDDGSAGQVSVQVTNSQGSSGILPVQKTAYTPALFRLSVEQGNNVIAQTTDGKLVGNYMVGHALGTPTQVRQAKPGEIVTLYGTGFGPTSPALPSDALVATAAQLASPVQFTIGGAAAVVKWAGMTGAGLYQFNIQVPNVAGGDLVIVAEIAGYRSQGDSVISVSNP